MPDPRVWAFHDSRGYGSLQPSGCGWFRVQLPFDQLQLHGWRAGYACGLPPDGWGEVDVFVAQRADQPSFRPVWDMLRQLDDLKLVYEIDDDPFRLDPVNWLARRSYDDEDVLASIRHMAATADLVTVTTPELAGRFAEFNGNIAVLPNFLPASLLTMQRRRHEQVTVGYTCGASHARDVALIAQTWRDVTDETGCRSHFAGYDFRPVTRPHGFDFTPWEPEPLLCYRNIDFDIGLAPLSGHPFNGGKSPVKAMEYAALGIPVIASDHPVYRALVIDGVTGFLCRSQAEWRDRMRLLISDEALRESMGAKAREQAAGWTIEGNWQRWAEAYRELAGES